jgi:hypothetical protein
MAAVTTVEKTARPEKRMDWCVVRLESDLNWWVLEADWMPEDPDEGRLAILDPRQVEYVFDLLEPLREFGLQNSVVERAFLRFSIDKDLGGGRVRLTATREEIAESDEKLFALPNTFSESYGGYAEFLDHVSHLRIKYLNSIHRFAQQLTVDELEDEVRDAVEGTQIRELPAHLFQEIAGVLEYCPAGFSGGSGDGEDGEGLDGEVGAAAGDGDDWEA